MTYTKKQFIEDVKKEARALRKHATKKELQALELAILDPNHNEKCVYGQMTGSCTSYRAAELIYQSCKRYFHNPRTSGNTVDFAEFKKKVNGAKIKGISDEAELHDARDWSLEYLSSIESYILIPNAKNKNLIDYLKGNRNDLVL
jgi:hypothetical protein